MTRRAVGVLGGMGPAATWDFCERLLAATPAARDQDHLRVLVDCDPSLPDRNAAVRGDGPSPGPRLAAMALGLVGHGAELLCMPCNAAHAFAGAVREATDAPFVDMVDATADATLASLPEVARVGLLATTATHEAGTYTYAFGARGVELVATPEEDLATLMQVVYAVKAGDRSPARRAEMRALAERAVAHGAQAVIAACTEVPLLLRADELEVPLVVSSDALAHAVVRAATRS